MEKWIGESNFFVSDFKVISERGWGTTTDFKTEVN